MDLTAKQAPKDVSRRQAREEWIDTARCLMIYAIVLGHTLRGATELYQWLFSFHVPMSIMISGMVAGGHGQRFGPFAWRRFVRLMIPYYCFSLLSIGIYAVIGQTAEDAVGGGRPLTVVQCLGGMLLANSKSGAMRWNTPLWYVPMFFVMSLMGYWTGRIRRGRDMALAAALSVGIGALVYESGPAVRLPFALETAACCLPFFLLGGLLHRACAVLKERGPIGKLALAAALILAGELLRRHNGPISVRTDRYGNYVLFLLSALSSSSGFIVLSMLWPRGVRPLNYVGRNTMSILLMHKFPIMLFVTILPVTKRLAAAYPIVTSAAVAAVTVLMCLAADRIICLAAPWMVGKGRVR